MTAPPAARRPRRARPPRGTLRRASSTSTLARRIDAAFAELRELNTSGQVDPERTSAMLAGDLEIAPMESTTDEVPTSIRAPRALLDRADVIADRITTATGAKVSRSAVLRRALELGIAALESEMKGDEDEDSADLRAEVAELRARLDRLEGHSRG